MEERQRMKVTLRAKIVCPACKTPMEIETGFWGSIFFGCVIAHIEERFLREGGKFTCGNCKKVSYVEPKTGKTI